MTLAVHIQTQDFIEHSSKHLPQSLLLTGPVGIGLLSVARHIAALHSPYVHIIEPDSSGKSKSIGVEVIRNLYDTVRTKARGKRIVIIDDADSMTLSAQNAFLKLLEEPGLDTHFLLIAHHTNNLLPTIRSRVQQKRIHPISSEQTAAYVTQLGVTDDRKKQQLLYIANGLPAELYRLVHDESYFTTSAQHIKDARKLLQATTYEKLTIAHRYKDDRDAALKLIEAAMNVTRRTLSDNPQTELIHRLASLSTTYDELRRNQNIRLCLAKLVL